MFSRDELTRYSRHIFLPEIGKKGQSSLKNSRVLVVGAGGLGSPVLMYLSAAGVGHITIIDDDKVELVNLQRQVLYKTDDIGFSKAQRSAHYLTQLNPEIEIQPLSMRLQPSNALGLIGEFDLLIETSDNFPTKFLVNDVCIIKKTPLIMGGILRFFGQVQWILPGQTACYRCIFSELPPVDAVPNCSEAGVFGAVAGVIGSFQASLAIKFLCDLFVSDSGITEFDLLDSGVIRKIALDRSEKCLVCSDNAKITTIHSKNYNFEE